MSDISLCNLSAVCLLDLVKMFMSLNEPSFSMLVSLNEHSFSMLVHSSFMSSSNSSEIGNFFNSQTSWYLIKSEIFIEEMCVPV